MIAVQHQGEWFTFVPTKLRRSLFWSFHYPRHEGFNYMVEKIKQQKFFFPNMANTILDFLTQCPCVLAKESRPPPYQGKKSIFARDVLQIVSLDLFEYDKQQYLTMMDIFSRYAFGRPINNKQSDTVMKAYLDSHVTLLSRKYTNP